MTKTIEEKNLRDELLTMAMEEGCNYGRGCIFVKFIIERGWINNSFDYKLVWAKRFASGEEWNKCDYEGRRILQKVAPNEYPLDLDFIN